MKKRMISLTIALILIFSLCATAFAAARANVVSPTISFSGTTVVCEASISALGNNISATLELWSNGVLIDSWYESGQHVVNMSGTHPGISGREYSVKVSGNIAGVPIVCYPVTGVCP